jgi:hypothetical protein
MWRMWGGVETVMWRSREDLACQCPPEAGGRGSVGGAGSSSGWSRGVRGMSISGSGHAQGGKRGDERRWHGVTSHGGSQWGCTCAESGRGVLGTSSRTGGSKASSSTLSSGAASRGLVRGRSGRWRTRVAGLAYPDSPKTPNVGDDPGHGLLRPGEPMPLKSGVGPADCVPR